MDSQPRSNAGPVWKWVIDDVCTRMKPSFIQEGVDASVLDDLRKQWESKMIARGILDAPLAPAAPQQPPALAHTAPPRQPQQQATGSSAVPPSFAQIMSRAPENVQQLMHQLIQQARAGAAGGGVPGSSAALPAGFKRSRADADPTVPQRDGPVDNQGAGTSTAAAAEGNDEELLSEDSEHEEDQSFENYLICQFEKVNRNSGGRKWKVTLKDGVLHSNGKDYVFTKATGEWSWT